jgi:DNA mismatch repair protein MutS
MLARDGGFIAKGFDPGLDKALVLRDESRRVIAGLEAQYRELSGVKNLKIKHNNVLGYFLEAPPSQADKMLSKELAETFIHRQTLVSGIRFTTGELADLDAQISRARDEALARELEIFERLVGEVMARAQDIADAAEAAAILDVAAGLATQARDRNYVRPRIEDSTAFEITGGRHPVVEAALAAAGAAKFTPNDCRLGADASRDGRDEGRLWLVTGPNMAGKSTFLRQNALIAILAQAGSFVPADEAHIGVADRVFSRVGASDDIAQGRSTFMVEMVETAAILNQAGPRSLVILDEIGRGTSTFDGMSIAWAAAEHLHDVNKCRGLFATHYHELTQLADRLDRLENVSMQVREWKGDVVFLHEVGPGPADRSYGVAVARLAGMPTAAVNRAGALLKILEKDRRKTSVIEELPLFAAASHETVTESGLKDARNSALLEALGELEPDQVSPRAALEMLYRLKAMADNEEQT